MKAGGAGGEKKIQEGEWRIIVERKGKRDG
jgi:hypothetical protein